MTINETTAEIWNRRLRQCMDEYEEGKLSQQTLADKFGTNQKTVFKWLHVGQSSKKETYHFPRYETMREIAKFFKVQVGYLTGETDSKTFETQDAVRYLGLSEKAVERIRLATHSETAFRTLLMDSAEARGLMNSLFESEKIFDLLTEMLKLDRAYSDPGISERSFAKLEKKHGTALLNKAFDLDPYSEESPETDYAPELIEAYLDIENTIDDIRNHDLRVELEMEAMRYRVTTSFSGLLNELYPPSRPSN